MFILEAWDPEIKDWELLAEDVEHLSTAYALFRNTMEEGRDCRLEYVKLEKKHAGTQ